MTSSRYHFVAVAFCTGLLLASAGAGYAQSVFAPSEDSQSDSGSSSYVAPPAPVTPEPTAPKANNRPSSGSTILAPAAPSRSAGTVQGLQLPPGGGTLPPGFKLPTREPLKPEERDETAYRRMGIEIPKTPTIEQMIDPKAGLAGYTPEQIAEARKLYAAMAAQNPARAARNPFEAYDVFVLSTRLEEAFRKRTAAACDNAGINIQISQQSLRNNKVAQEVLTKTVMPTLGNILQDTCSSQEGRARISNNAPFITVVNRKGATPDFDVGEGFMTFNADFTVPDALVPGAIRARFDRSMKAIEEENARNYKAEELESR